MRTLLDRPHTNHIKNFDRMVTELSPYMTEIEIDLLVEFMVKVSDSKHDINPSIEDSKTQIKLIIGADRYEEVVWEWKKNNQKLLTSFGTRKYQHKKDKTIWDGLDDTDNPDDYEVIYV